MENSLQKPVNLPSPLNCSTSSSISLELAQRCIAVITIIIYVALTPVFLRTQTSKS